MHYHGYPASSPSWQPKSTTMTAYWMLIIHLARKHGGMGWLAYDSLFRQQQAAWAGHKWEELNPSLMATTVLGVQSEPCGACSLCLASDHVSTECALQSFEYYGRAAQLQQFGHGQLRSQSSVGYQPRNARTRPYPPPGPVSTAVSEICKRFNRGICSLNPCKYEHMCSGCNRGGHCLLECPKGKGPKLTGSSASTPPAPGPK